jgi:hypothetical protein
MEDTSMHKPLRAFANTLLPVALFLMGLPAAAEPQAASSKVSVTTVVTVLGPNYTAPPPVTKQDVNVYSGKTRLDVTGWVPAQGEKAGLQLAILIDNAVDPSLGNQFKDLTEFINSQPKDTAVGLYYAEHGTVDTASDFSTDHAAVAKKLRLPFGPRAAASPSVYLSLSSLIKKWPSTGARREVLMIASGTDLLQPGISDPYFDSALANAQKAGVLVHSIYAGGRRLGRTFRGMISQSNLGQLTNESGGQAFFQGIETPVSFAPYLKQLDAILRNQYLLTFTTAPSAQSKGELRSIEIRTEQRNVKLLYPRQILVPRS